MKNRKTKRVEQRAVSRKTEESDEARGIRESIEEMERELAELDRDIAEAKKGDKGEMSRVALESFCAMRKDIVVYWYPYTSQEQFSCDSIVSFFLSFLDKPLQNINQLNTDKSLS